MAHELGGDVLAADRREYGPANVSITTAEGLFEDIDREQPVWMSHGDSITRLPDGFTGTAQTDSNPFAGLAAPERNLYGIQFHPEVVHTPRGKDVLRNFVVGIAGIEPTWTAANFIDTTVAGIRERVDRHAAATGSDGLVICALSGGVDSAVAAALVHRAVGDRLTCIYVDHGLMRKQESELLRVTFERDLGMNLVMVDARERFLARLAGVEDPEQKRRIIGDEFIRVFEEEADQARAHRLPDPGHALPGRHRIRDVGDQGRPEDQDPPQRRRAARRPALPADRAAALPVQGRGPPGRHEMGLPDAMVLRQPFPGPGLAIRIIGEVTAERLDTLREADWIVIDEIKGAGLYRNLWQSFAILTPVRSVGVMGDGRTYANVVAIRAVTSEDGMTADWAKLPYDVLGRSRRGRQRGPGVDRVVYDISSSRRRPSSGNSHSGTEVP